MDETATTPAVAESAAAHSASLSRDPARDPVQRATARGSATDVRRTNALSRELFFRHLYLEKRRSDRTGAPLALVVGTIDCSSAETIAKINAVIEMFGASKRETDLLGQLDERTVGVLLPHTRIEGAQSYLNGIRENAAAIPVELQAGEYPGDLFEHVLKESVPESVAVEYIAQSPSRHGVLSTVSKRLLDVAGALIGIAILSPIMLLTAIAVGVSSRGPVIFRQCRLGRGGKPFVLYKFRSMRTDADDSAHREYVANLIDGNLDEINQGDSDKPLYKMAVDPRITKVGRIIRKTSLDELPQLFNVLKGDMSLVGPRPPLPYEAEKYKAWHLRRILEVQPGITGLWQVEGRSTTSFDDMVRLDLRYAYTRSFWLDLRIILRTVSVLFGSHGAT